MLNWSADTAIEQCPFLAVAIGIILKETNYIIHEHEVRVLRSFFFVDPILIIREMKFTVEAAFGMYIRRLVGKQIEI